MTVDAASFLDNPETYESLDPTGFRERIGGLPQQCLWAWEQALRFTLPASDASARNVVVVGMGGSAIGGDLLRDLTSLEESPQVEVCRDYNLPQHVGPDHLVIVSSYSGDTEETLAAFQEAVRRRARVAVVTTGGRLGQMAQQQGIPLFLSDYAGEPRTALGYSFMVPLAMLQELRLIAPKDQAVGEAVQVLSSLAHRLRPDIPTRDNPAKELAVALHGKLIVVFGGGILAGVARRWKTQFNENSKAWAFAEVLPDAGHNTIVGLRWPRSVSRKTCGVFLNALSLHPRIKLRYEVIEGLLAKAGVGCRTVDGVGKGALAQILSAVMFGDYTSYYLAMLNGEDPSPVAPIEHLKDRLASLG